MDGRRRKELREEIGDLAMAGLQIETVTVEAARKGPWGCAECEEKEDPKDNPEEEVDEEYRDPNQMELELQEKGGV